MASEISVDRPRAGVAVLTLDAPARRNALTVEMAEELERASQMWSMRRKALRD